MKCKRGHEDDWYVRGKYRRCNQCHRETVNRYDKNEKLGIRYQRKTYPARPLSQAIAVLRPNNPVSCRKGHLLTPDNLRVEIDKKGKPHNRCKQCNALYFRKRYGIPVESRLRDLLTEKSNPWDEI